MSTQNYLIGEASQATGLSRDTIRFYEQQGLIRPSRQGTHQGAYRTYDEQNIRELAFIVWAKKAGFTLKEIEELLSWQTVPKNACHEIKKSIVKKITRIDEKIQSLKEASDILKKLHQQCTEEGPENCPILDILMP